MSIIKKSIYFTLLLGFNLPLYAGQYSVEIVLFKQLNTQGIHSEYWNRPELISNTIDINADQTHLNNDQSAWAEYNLQNQQFLPMSDGISELPNQYYTLNSSADHLRYSPNYQLLAHFGWIQKSRSKQSALPIRLIHDKLTSDIIPSGELKLYISRFLHIQVDLKATQCITSHVDPQTCDTHIYTFKQNRKMRSQELHYLSLECLFISLHLAHN